MKKFISLLLAVLLLAVMLTAFAVPAFAVSELKTDEETDELYEEFTFEVYSGNHKVRTIEGNNFNIETNNSFNKEIAGGRNGDYTKIYVRKGTNVIITRIEARVSGYPAEYGKVGVTAGEKREKEGVSYDDTVHIDEVGRSELSFAGGSGYVRFDLIKVYYKEHEHIWGGDELCETCGARKCYITGTHTWNENGRCEYCGALKCDVTGQHDLIKETRILVKECAYCGSKISEEVIQPETTAFTVSDGNILIIACAASAIVFGVGGFLLGRKKVK